MTMTMEPDHDFAELFGSPPGDDEMASLYARLAAEADEDGLLDVAYRTLDTPVGTLLLAAASMGLVRVAYEREGLDQVLHSLAGRISPRILETPRRLDKVARQLGEYFAGRRTSFDLPIDLRLSAGFRRSVLSYLPAIGYGETASYQSVAAAVHNPGPCGPSAPRARPTRCRCLPCHRVIRSDGQLGAYLGGPEIKHQLLDMEARR